MKPIVIRRLPQASAALVVLALIAHVGLCHPAATSRGFPPIHPFWETLAPILVFPAVLLFSFFDDRRKARRYCLWVFVPLACLVMCIAFDNVMDARPRYGCSVGMFGLLVHDSVPIFLLAGFTCLFVYPASRVVEKVAAMQWEAWREFAEPGSDAPLIRFSTRALLGGVAILGCLLAVWPLARERYRTWPRAEFSHLCDFNLRRIGVAMQEYYATYAAFPPAYISDDKGKPIHSWRVLLLPFLGDGEREIYKAYHFDEPWNGPNNRRLAERMPDVYRCAWILDPKWTQTSYVVVVGRRTAFPGGRSRKFIPDGTSNTVLAIEYDHSGIHWMEPRDLDFDSIDFAMKDRDPTYPRYEHFGGRRYSLHGVCADGMSAPRGDLSSDGLRALLTADGGEPNPFE